VQTRVFVQSHPLSLGPAAFVAGTGVIGASAVEAVYLPLLAIVGEMKAADRILRSYWDASFKAGERITHR